MIVWYREEIAKFLGSAWRYANADENEVVFEFQIGNALGELHVFPKSDSVIFKVFVGEPAIEAVHWSQRCQRIDLDIEFGPDKEPHISISSAGSLNKLVSSMSIYRKLGSFAIRSESFWMPTAEFLQQTNES